MKNRSAARLALVGAVMAGSTVAGVATIAAVGAQDDTTTTSADEAVETSASEDGHTRAADVLDGLVEDGTLTREQAVSEGWLTEEKADARLADLAERTTAIVNGEKPPRRPGDHPSGHQGPSHHGGTDGDGAVGDATG